MIPRNVRQPSFTTGEISPRMYGRVDVSRFDSALKTLKNFIIWPQGGVYRRPGTRYAAAVKNSANATRIIPFEFSDQQAYILEFGNEYMRVYKDSAQVLDGGNPYEITTPYSSSDLFEIQFAQSADVLYLVHKDYAPRQITRTGDTSWTIAEIDFFDGPWLDENDTTTTLTVSAASGSITITASSTTGINNDTGFQSTDVGRFVRIRNGSNVGYAEITGVTSTTLVDATVATGETMPTGAQTDWRLGAFSETTGYPRAISFHDQRLGFAGTTNDPETVWLSVVNDYVNFDPNDPEDASAVLDDSAIKFTLAAGKVNVIRWMISSNVLLIGTIGAEFRAWAGDSQTALTPSNITINEVGDSGSTTLRPLKINSSVLFVQRSERTLREFTYDFTIEGYRNKDLTILSEHLMRDSTGIVDIAWQQEPDQVVWLAREDGKLIGMTYMRDQEVIGFHVHEIGGSFGSDSFGRVESVASIPHPDGDQDQLWMVVKRTINGSTARYVEYLEKPHYATNQDDKSGACFVDSSVEYDGASTSTFSGLTHLEGEDVSLLLDGASHPALTVSSGSVTSTRAFTKGQAGLSYQSRLRTLETELQGEGGTSQGKIGRIHELQIRFKDSLACEYGVSLDKMDTLYFRGTNDPLSQSPPLYTGYKDVKIRGDYRRENDLYIQTSQPYPIEILGIYPMIIKYE